MSKMKKLLALLLALAMIVALATACNKPADDNPDNPPDGPDNPDNPPDGPDNPDNPGEGLGYTITEFDPNATYTQRTALTVLYSNWNPHDYKDGNAISLFNPLADNLYTLTWNDELHNPDNLEPWTAYAIIPQMAADMATDVTAEVKAEHPDWIPESATEGYAWAIPLREDLYFDTGYHITAETYVQSMKYLLDSRLQNYRATDIYNGARGIVGAEEYFKSGYSLDNFLAEDAVGNTDLYADPSTFTTTDKGTLQLDGKDLVLNINSAGNWGGSSYAVKNQSDAAAKYPNIQRLLDAADSHGWVYLTADLLKDLQDYIALLQGYPSVEEYAASSAGDYAYIEFEEMIFLGYEHDAVDYDSTVGFYAKDEYTLVQVFKSSVSGFYLYWGSIQDSLVLVEPEVYESCLTQDESGAWTCSYMTSKETSPSYGAYSMVDYQTDKQVSYTKNPGWYGWTDDVNHVYKDPNDGNVYRTNQTTDMVWQVVPESSTQLQMFLSGQLSSYGLDAIEDYTKYNYSDYLLVSPSDGTGGLWVTGNMTGLNAREAADGFDPTKEDVQTIGLTSFHKALAVSFDRQAFIDEAHPDYVTNFGVIGTMYVYDVDTMATYRTTDQAKQALCNFYSVDTSKYASLDEAVASITGYDPETAKTLYQAAFEESLELGYITDTDNDGKCDQNITMIFASSAPADYVTRRINYLNKSIAAATVGTPFEGKITIVESAPLSNDYLNAFASGAADCFIVAVSGSVFDPFSIGSMYLDPAQAVLINQFYDPTSDMLTLTVNGEEITMSAFDWYQALNGTIVTVDGKEYVYGMNDADVETRLNILAGLENKILQLYYMLPMMQFGGKTLISMQRFYVLDEWVNPIIEYGPSRYNYSDQEWAEFVEKEIAEHGALQY